MIYIFHALISIVHRVLPALPLHNLLRVYKKLSYHASYEDSSKSATCVLFILPILVYAGDLSGELRPER